jgi:hypothetical protein
MKTILMLAGLALLAPRGAAAQPDAAPWKFSLMPYLWLPSVDGRLRFGPPPVNGAPPTSASMQKRCSTTSISPS